MPMTSTTHVMAAYWSSRWFCFMTAKASAPMSAALTYTVPAWNASGSRFMQMSRTMPPPFALMVPRMTAGTRSRPAESALPVPMMAHSATDRLSKKSMNGSKYVMSLPK